MRHRLLRLLSVIWLLGIAGTAAADNLSVLPAAPAETAPAGLAEPFFLYQDDIPDQQLPYIPSGWMGDWGDLTFINGSTEQPYAGRTCIQITYSAKATQHQGWAGIFWQRPANNWGDKDAGQDLTGARHLAFWARGERGGEVIEKFQVGGIKGKFSDTCEVMIGPVTLTTDWKEYLIPLEGKDLTRIIGGFVWATSKRVNPQGATFYLDNIRFE